MYDAYLSCFIANQNSQSRLSKIFTHCSKPHRCGHVLGDCIWEAKTAAPQKPEKLTFKNQVLMKKVLTKNKNSTLSIKHGKNTKI